MAEENKNDTVYDTKKLSKYFAVSALVLLVAVVWAILEDYDRPWKSYVRQFQKIQTALGTARLAEAKKALDQSKLTALEKELEELQKAEADIVKDIDQTIKKFEDKYYLSNKAFQELKALQSAELFLLETKIKKADPDAPRMKQAYDERAKKLKVLKVQQEKDERSLNEAKGMKLDILKNEKALLDKKNKTFKKINSLKKIISQNEASLGNILRNAPVVDFMVPTVKINQVILPDLKDDYFFNKVPRVDRCITCHATIDKVGFEDFPQPFKTHPKLALIAGPDSPHPVAKMGCTGCHGGVPQSVNFTKAAHVPRDPKQNQEWEEKYHFHPDHHIKTHMVPLQMVEGKCIQCHSQEVQLEGAPTLNAGLRLIERYGCYNCHKFEGHFDRLAQEKKSGPSLNRLKGKLTEEWVQKWLWNPKSFRPNTLMPAFWQVHNNSDEASMERSKVEVESITHYLFEKSEDYEPLQLASGLQGNIDKGKEILGSRGCLACHASSDFPRENPESPLEQGWKDPRVPLPGPSLDQMGSKVTRDWLISWLKNPKHYWQGTIMPQLFLTDQEAVDLTEYLLSKRNLPFENELFPQTQDKVRDELVVGYLKKRLPPKEAEVKLASMSLGDKKLFLGEKFISHYACYACHALKGFEDAPMIGAELTREGSKDVSKFAFENVHIPHTSREEWIYTKIRTPRIWDVGKIRDFESKARMPHFGLSKDQANAIASVVIGHENRNVNESIMKPVDGRMEDIIEGQRVINRYNCVGCHVLENQAGHILAHYKDDLSMGPPNLNSEGSKVQTDWLYKYLLKPNMRIRPWLDVRMPYFQMTPEEVTALTKYFAALDRAPYPFEKKAAQILTSQDRVSAHNLMNELACLSCHAPVPPGGDASAAAPLFKDVKERLRPEWVSRWLKDPNAIMPGTRMPQLWPPEDPDDPKTKHIAVPGYFGDDADKQIDKMRDYLFQYE